ncbi:MAG: hypothetical protein ABWY00_12610 [Dongiaceae bacterium]
MLRLSRLTGYVIAAALLSACSSVPPSSPTTNLENRQCNPSLDLAGASGLSLDGPTKVKVTLDAHAPCLQITGGARSLYTAIKLPPEGTPYLISVTSRPLGQGLFSPHLLLLDSQGKQLREIQREAFLFHGTALRVGIRAHPDEAYLVIASDPQSVGGQVSQISENTQMTYVPVGVGGFVQYHTGIDTTSTYTYAHNGLVEVAVEPVPDGN